jgi:hypothetical protein
MNQDKKIFLANSFSHKRCFLDKWLITRYFILHEHALNLQIYFKIRHLL